MSNPKGVLRIYGCGGLGVNIASKFIDFEVTDAQAEIKPCFIDTSRSNFKQNVEDTETFVFKDKDGSGKVRRENVDDIKPAIPSILLSLVPGDINVVVFSASGGSGSVIGPLLVNELLAKGHSVVVLAVGSSECAITSKNSVDTLKSLAAISTGQKVPVVLHYDHNSSQRLRDSVDGSLYFKVIALSILGSRKNLELDSKDLFNWLRYTNTTNVAPGLSILDIITDKQEIKEIDDPISIASIYANTGILPIDALPDYSCVGYLQYPVHFNETDTVSEIHYVVSNASVESIFSNVKGFSDKCVEKVKARQKVQSIVKNDEVDDEYGLVL